MNNIQPPGGGNKQSIDQTWGSGDVGLKNKSNSDISQDISNFQSQKDKKAVDIYKSEQEKIQKPAEELPAQQEIQSPQKTSLLISILKAIGIFAGVFVFVYLFLTFPAQYEKIKYWLNHLGKKDEPQTIEIPENIDNSSDLFLSTIKSALETDKPIIPESEPAKPDYSIDITDLENNHLIIPKLDKKVPIIWNSPPDEDVMMKNLQNGIVHYNGTGLPNESDSNVFMSGHSSYYWWDKGNYKTVFANLNQLDVGDEVALAYEDKVYIYRVYEKLEVKPKQVDVLDSVDRPIVSLMTCVPVGTNLRRLIVRAERIESDAKTEKPEPEPSPTVTETATPTQIEPSGLNPLDIINLLPWRW